MPDELEIIAETWQAGSWVIAALLLAFIMFPFANFVTTIGLWIWGAVVRR